MQKVPELIIHRIGGLYSHFKWTFFVLHHCSCEAFFGWGKQSFNQNIGICAHCGKWMEGLEAECKRKTPAV